MTYPPQTSLLLMVAHRGKSYEAADTYKVKWNGANLTDGVYFNQLKAGDFMQTEKMILLK